MDVDLRMRGMISALLDIGKTGDVRTLLLENNNFTPRRFVA